MKDTVLDHQNMSLVAPGTMQHLLTTGQAGTAHLMYDTAKDGIAGHDREARAMNEALQLSVPTNGTSLIQCGKMEC